tara:strand:+ start:27337 stop:27891 length:555 start_codon:yes stop_codon:yes gene_type:complete
MFYKKFPFLKSFPFDHYEISGGEETGNKEGKLSELFDDELYNFKYFSRDKDITISFYDSDIEFLNRISSEIKSLDSIRKSIDKGLNSDDMLIKFSSIRKAKTFLKKVKSPAEDAGTFKTVLNGLQEINEVNLSKDIIKKIDKLDKKLKDEKLNVNESITIDSYLDFQLHHAKIMLGVVIASKIH